MRYSLGKKSGALEATSQFVEGCIEICDDVGDGGSGEQSNDLVEFRMLKRLLLISFPFSIVTRCNRTSLHQNKCIFIRFIVIHLMLLKSQSNCYKRHLLKLQYALSVSFGIDLMGCARSLCDQAPQFSINI